MKVGDAAGPVGVDVGHVHPGGEWPRKGVEEAFFWLVDFSDTKDVVDVVDDCEAGRGDEVGCCVTRVCSAGVDVQTLDLGRRVACCNPLTIDWDKPIKVTLIGCRDWEFNSLVAALRSSGSSSALFTRGSSCWRGT